jgi:hypothetical protein
MFNDVSEKLFELVIQKRQYKNYLNCLKLYSVPPCLPLFTANQFLQANSTFGQTSQTLNVDTISEIAQAPSVINTETDKSSSFDIRLYNDLMDSIPPEYVSTQLVLHCMVEQVVSNDEKISNERSSTSTSRIQNLNSDITQHFSNLVMNLPLSQKDKEVQIIF